MIAIKSVTEKDDIMIITRSGLTIRLAVANLRLIGRATQGVKLMRVDEGTRVACVEIIPHQEEEETDEQ